MARKQNKNSYSLMDYNPEFNPTAFQGITIKSQPRDINILARSLAQIKANEDNSYIAKSQSSDFFTKERDKLYNDAKVLSWFDDKTNNILQGFDERMNAGDTTEAYRFLQDGLFKFKTDPELVGRQNLNTQYSKWKEELKDKFNKGQINKNVYDYQLKYNPYKEDTITDEFGNVKGFKDFVEPTTYNKVDYANLYLTAYKMYNPDTTTKDNSFNNTYEAESDSTGLSGAPIRQVTTGGRTQTSITQVSPEVIKQNVDKLLIQNPDIERAINLEYLADKEKYEELNNKLNNNQELTEDESNEYDNLKAALFDGGGVSLKHYRDYMLVTNGYSESLAHTTLSNLTSSNNSNLPIRNNTGGRIDINGDSITPTITSTEPTVPGAFVNMISAATRNAGLTLDQIQALYLEVSNAFKPQKESNLNN